MEHIKRKYGKVAILTATKNEIVKKLIRGGSWEEIGYDNYLRIRGYDEDYVSARSDEAEEEGFTSFLFLPK